MMRQFFILLALFSSTLFSNASTMGLFYPDDSEAAVIVRGTLSDDDVTRLFNIMAVEEIMDSGYRTKRLQFFEDIKLDCALSPRFPNVGTCKVSFIESADTKIDYAEEKIHYEVQGEKCDEFVTQFKHLENTGVFAVLYQTTNKRFSINWDQSINSCVMEYQ